MKLITKNSDYAIRSISYLARKGGRITVTEMSRDLKIPRPFLRKILQKLNSSGILSSSKGKGGGFTLAVPPEKIRLSEIITIFQGPVKISDCLIKAGHCTDMKNCRLREKIGKIRALVDRELGSETLDSLI